MAVLVLAQHVGRVISECATRGVTQRIERGAPLGYVIERRLAIGAARELENELQ